MTDTSPQPEFFVVVPVFCSQDSLQRLLEVNKAGPDVIYATHTVKQQSFWKNIGSWRTGMRASQRP